MTVCTGKILTTVIVKGRRTFTVSVCKEEAVDDLYCVFHQYIQQSCLECGGKLAHVDGEIFCQKCLAYLPPVIDEKILAALNTIYFKTPPVGKK